MSYVTCEWVVPETERVCVAAPWIARAPHPVCVHHAVFLVHFSYPVAPGKRCLARVGPGGVFPASLAPRSGSEVPPGPCVGHGDDRWAKAPLTMGYEGWANKKFQVLCIAQLYALAHSYFSNLIKLLSQSQSRYMQHAAYLRCSCSLRASSVIHHA